MRWRVLALLALLALTGCVGPLGRLGLEPEVVGMLTADTAAWCVTVDMATLLFGVSAVRVSYWRDNAPERGLSNMQDCTVRRVWRTP